MGMLDDKHPCNMCNRDCLYFDCVWYTAIGDEYCNNYDCIYEHEGSCKLGFASRCAMSTEFKEEEEEDEEDED